LGLLFGGGSGVDHGILLGCYFMKLNVRAWLLLGTGVSLGEAAYVLTSRPLPDNPAVTVYDVWDPLTGQKYSTHDSFTPIHEVYCLINVDNVNVVFVFRSLGACFFFSPSTAVVVRPPFCDDNNDPVVRSLRICLYVLSDIKNVLTVALTIVIKLKKKKKELHISSVRTDRYTHLYLFRCTFYCTRDILPN